MKLKRGITISIILVLALALVFATSLAFANIGVVEASYSSLEELVGLEIDVSNIEDYITSELIANTEDEEVQVIVIYNDSKNHNIQNDLKALNVDITTRYNYSELFYGAAITIMSSDLLNLADLSYVKSVSLEVEYSVQAYTDSVSGTTDGVIDNNTAYQGEGMVVAVLDAGFDLDHSEYSVGSGISSTIDLSDIRECLTKLNSYELTSETAASLYVSEKVVYAYDYADYDTNVYYSDSSHGTHTSTTIAGTSCGVVPNAQLALMKVGDDEGSIYTSSLVAALEDCVILGVDVVSCSIGTTAAGFATYNGNFAWEEACNAAEDAGIVILNSAGNSATSSDNIGTTDYASYENIDNGTINAPASNSSTYSVGAMGQYYYFLIGEEKVFGEHTVLVSNGEYYYQDYYRPYLDYCTSNGISDGKLQYVIVYNSNGEISNGAEEDFDGIDLTGKIAIVKRTESGSSGVDSSYISNIAATGAIAIMMIDVTEVPASRMANSDALPVVVLSSDAESILIANADSTTNEGTLVVNETYCQIKKSTFSSVGVNTDITMGIDFVSYGSYIRAGVNGGEYSTYSGTSMSTPNAAGAFTAVIQYVKANAATFNIDTSADDAKTQIRDAASKLIMSNANLIEDENGVLYSPRTQGAGLVDIDSAVNALSYIQTYDQDGNSISKTKIELFDNVTSTFELYFTIVNANSTDTTYNLSIDVLTEYLTSNNLMSGYEKSLSYTINSVTNATKSGDNWVITVSSGSEVSITVSITLSDEAISYLEQYPNGIYLEGYVKLDDISTSNEYDLSVPFIGFYGDWDDAPMLDITNYEEANGEESAGLTNIFYGLYAGSYYLELGKYAYSVSDEYDGETPSIKEEFAAVSIYSSSLYSIGAMQLALLRNAEYLEILIVDNVTGEVLGQTGVSYVAKYTSSYQPVYTLSISPYSFGMANNGKYSIIVNTYRAYDEDSDDNIISDSFTQNFYVDYEAPQVTDISYSQSGDRLYATLTMFDNHYIQAVAACVGTGTSTTSVTLSMVDVFPVATSASGVGKTVTQTIDITDAYNSATNGYIYFYVVDYAFNYVVYYVSTKNAGGTTINGDTDTSNSSSSTPSTKSMTDTALSFRSTEISINVNQEINLASTAYLTGYSSSATYTWTTSNSDILAISDGKITGLATGVCAVTVTNSSSQSTTIIVRVVNEATIDGATYQSTYVYGYEMKDTLANSTDSFFTIDITSDSIDLAPGESFKLTYSYKPYNYNYVTNPIVITMDTSDASIVSVTNNVISAVSAGDATINVYAKHGDDAAVLIATYEITVCDELYIKNGELLACFKTNTNIDLSSETNITSIGSNAFTYAENVTTVILPSTCVSIKENAFKDNITITTVTITSNSVTSIYENAFDGCISLSAIDVTGVRYIASEAFKGCIGLTSVVMDSSTKANLDIKYDAFSGCNKLDSFTIDGLDVTNLVIEGKLVVVLDYDEALSDTTITSLGEGVFVDYSGKTIDLSNMTGLKAIGYKAFSENEVITKVIIPSTIITIGNEAFYNCTSLSIVDFASGITELSIGDYAFANTKISTIDLSGINTSFGDYSFACDTSLVYVNMGSVQEIGDSTFVMDSALLEVEFEEGSLSLGTSTFSYYISGSKTYYCSSLKSVTIPSTITEIGDYVFTYCTALTSVDLSNITEIGDYAFYQTTSLSSIEAKNVTSVGYGAFAYTSAQSATLGTSLASGTLDIGNLAFYYASNLVTVSLPTKSDVDVVIGLGAFYECASLSSYSTHRRGGMFGLDTSTITGINFDRVIEIGDYAFAGCETLTSVSLPVATIIGQYAFTNANSLSSVSLSAVESIGVGAFINTSLSSITLPNTIDYIGAGAFAGLGLTISFRGTLTSENLIIESLSDGNYVIYNTLGDGSYELVHYPINTTATSYSVKSGASSIGAFTFYGATNLIRLTLPASVKYIGHAAFYNCTALSTVVFSGSTAPALLAEYSSSSDELYCNFVDYASNVSGLTLYVGSDSVKSSFASNLNWASFFSTIKVSTSIDVEDPDATIESFQEAMEDFGDTVNLYNYEEFEAIIAQYNSLSSEDKEILASTDEGAAALEKYNKLLEQYNALNIYSNSDSDSGSLTLFDLPSWAVVLIIIGIAVVILSIVAFATTYFSRRMLGKTDRENKKKEEEIKKTEKDFKDIFISNSPIIDVKAEVIERKDEDPLINSESDIFANNEEKNSENSTQDKDKKDDNDND